MKKLTDANASDAPRPKGPLDMRTIPQGDAAKKPLGPRFKKVAGPGAAPATTGGSRFKKVGVAVGEVKQEEKKGEVSEASSKPHASASGDSEKPAAETQAAPQAEANKDEDVVMVDDGDPDDIITWEEYDFTKPSDCDHANCPGCVMPANAVYEDGWLVVGTA